MKLAFVGVCCFPISRGCLRTAVGGRPYEHTHAVVRNNSRANHSPPPPVGSGRVCGVRTKTRSSSKSSQNQTPGLGRACGRKGPIGV